MSNKYNNSIGKNKSSSIKTLQMKIVELVNENQSLLKDKLKLQANLRYYRTLEDKIKKLRAKIADLQQKNDETILEKEKELKDMKSRYEKKIHEKEYELEKYQTNISIYNQKINMIRQIEMENDIYKNELQELKHKNEELIKSTKEKLDDLEIQNKVKYNHLKLSMIEHLKEAKNNVTKLNMNYMDTNGQISVLQNRNLIACLENVQEQCDELKEENLKLTKKIKDLENDISIHKKTEINLVLKLKEKNLKNNINNETFQYNIKNNNISLTNNNNISENKNNSFSSPPIINKSNNNSNSFENLHKHKLIKNKKNNLKLLITNSLYSGENDISNFFLKNNKEFNYRKYNLKLKEKDEKIENLELQVDKLNNKIDSYFMKYKGLFNYIEHCINEFYNDDKLKNINSNINLDNIKKFEFDSFDKKEQFSILVILMNYLKNILTFNFGQKNDNTNNDPPFFATNMKYMKNNFNLTKANFNYLYMKNPFVNRNNKIMNTFNSYRMNNDKLNFSISVLNDNNSVNDYRIKDTKYKTLI